MYSNIELVLGNMETFFSNYYHTFSIITNILTAIGTIGAVLCTMLLSIRNNKPRFKYIFSDNTRLIANNGDNFERLYISLNISNVGNRTAKISAWGVHSKKQLSFLLSANDVYAKTAMRKNRDLIEPGDDITLYFEYDKFCEIIKKMVTESYIKINEDIELFVRDNYGNEALIKTGIRARDLNNM